MSKLKACPFCGDVEDLQINDDSDKEGTMYVWCYACNVSGPSAVMPKDVWNHRPIEDSLKSHAVEVLFKYISRHHQMTEEKETCRADARALLGWEE